MGVRIVAYRHAMPVPTPKDEEEAYEAGLTHAFVYEALEASLRGLVADQWYHVANPVPGMEAPYSVYNDFRGALSRAALGVEPEVVWGNPDRYRHQPFYELINFADNEGTIGPLACADLAEDFAATSVRDRMPEEFR